VTLLTGFSPCRWTQGGIGVEFIVGGNRNKASAGSSYAGRGRRSTMWSVVGGSGRRGLAARGGAKLAPRLFRVLQLINGERPEQIQSVHRLTLERGFEITAGRTSETATTKVHGTLRRRYRVEFLLGADG
jgi:hypothetical protein